MQKDLFLQGEGDQWFFRNINARPSKAVFLYEKFIKKEDCILEIGCSDGRNLSYLSGKIGGGADKCIWNRPF